MDRHRRWLTRHGARRDGDLRLFCVPCAGHGASMYRPWADHLPRAIEVWALQPPGRENRLDEPASADLTQLVTEAADALMPLLDDRPFAILGHSMGALLGFEIARELRRRALPSPSRLIVSGQPAPHLDRTGPLRYHLPDPIFLDMVQEMNTALAGDGEYREAIRYMLPTLRADFTLCERFVYAPEPPLECDICAWGGDDDPEATLVQLASWDEHTSARFTLTMFPGNHFFVRSERKAVLRTLVQALEPLFGAALAVGAARSAS